MTRDIVVVELQALTAIDQEDFADLKEFVTGGVVFDVVFVCPSWGHVPMTLKDVELAARS